MFTTANASTIEHSSRAINGHVLGLIGMPSVTRGVRLAATGNRGVSVVSICVSPVLLTYGLRRHQADDETALHRDVGRSWRIGTGPPGADLHWRLGAPSRKEAGASRFIAGHDARTAPAASAQ